MPATTFNASNTGSSTYDSTGNYKLNLDACSFSYAYDGSGNITSETATDPGNGLVYVRTYTYSSGNISAVSGWVKQ